MASPFYNYTIATLTRGLNTLSTLLKKAEEYAKEKNIPLDELLTARLVEDMKPLSFQIVTATNVSPRPSLAQLSSNHRHRTSPTRPTKIFTSALIGHSRSLKRWIQQRSLSRKDKLSRLRLE